MCTPTVMSNLPMLMVEPVQVRNVPGSRVITWPWA